MLWMINRTGRWAGRLIQLQNLPQNHMDDLRQARELVRLGDYEALTMLYDDIPDTLSQLIRTAFIARPGYMFYVADFAAIEARVIAAINNLLFCHFPLPLCSIYRSPLLTLSDELVTP